MKNLFKIKIPSKLISLKAAQHMSPCAVFLLVLALLIKFVIGTDFCEIERTKCLGRPHIGCFRSFPVQLTHQSECFGLTKLRLNDWLKHAIVLEHNKLRNAVASGGVATFPSASHMLEMDWDVELEELACAHSSFCTEPLDPSKECRATHLYNTTGENSFASRLLDVRVIVHEAIKTWMGSTLNNPGDNSLRRILKEGNNRIGCCLAQFNSMNKGLNMLGPSRISRLSCMYKEDADPYQVLYETGLPRSKCVPRNFLTPSNTYASLCVPTQPLRVPISPDLIRSPDPIRSSIPVNNNHLYGIAEGSDRRSVIPPQVRPFLRPVKQPHRAHHRHHNHYNQRSPHSSHSSRRSLRRSLANIFKMFQAAPNDGDLNIGPNGIKFRRANVPKAMAIANAGFDLLGKIKDPSKPFDYDYSDLKKLIGSYEDYSDEDTDSEERSREDKFEKRGVVKESSEEENSDEEKLAPIIVTEKSQKLEIEVLPNPLLIGHQSDKRPKDSWNDPYSESETSVELMRSEHTIPLDMSAVMKGLTSISSCDINGEVIPGPMSPSECISLIQRKTSEKFSNQLQSQMPMNFFQSLPDPNLQSAIQDFNLYPSSYGSNGYGHHNHGLHGYGPHSHRHHGYGHGSYAHDPYVHHPYSHISHGHNSHSHGSHMSSDLSKSYLGNVLLPTLRRSLVKGEPKQENESEESKSDERESNDSSESGESNEKSDRRFATALSMQPPKWNVNLQSGITSINGKNYDLAEAKRKVPEIFSKVLSDLGLK